MFSLPIHERAEVVIDTLVNFKHYNPGCGIILHVSENFDFAGSALSEESFYEILERIGDVYVNPIHMKSGKHNIARLHIENFNYVYNHVHFEYFVTAASNMCFIKSGLYDFLVDNNYKAAFDYFDIKKKRVWESKICLQDTEYIRLLNSLHTDRSLGGQLEGNTYCRELMKKIVDAICAGYDFDRSSGGYQAEEILFQTAAMSLLDTNDKMYDEALTFMDWKRGLRVFIMNMKKVSEKYYSVKRVERKLDDGIRTYIREYRGGVLRGSGKISWKSAGQQAKGRIGSQGFLPILLE